MCVSSGAASQFCHSGELVVTKGLGAADHSGRSGRGRALRTLLTIREYSAAKLNGAFHLRLLDKMRRWREQRRHPRHRIISTAWLRVGDDPVPHVCVLWDISEGGARLSVTDMATVPKEFLLLLERDALRGTSCRVAWRQRDQIGLEFVDHADPKLRDLIRCKTAPAK
jgi:hypothetical protein